MAPAPKEDAASEAGRIAGRIVSKLGVRLLRTRPVREAVRRAHDEAQEDDAAPRGQPADPASQTPREASGPVGS